MNERQLCQVIVNALTYMGCMVWRENAGMIPIDSKTGRRMIRMAKAGTADIIGMTKSGRFIAVEVKMPKRKKNVTEHQLEFLAEVRRHGGVAGVATSPDEAISIMNGQN